MTSPLIEVRKEMIACCRSKVPARVESRKAAQFKIPIAVDSGIARSPGIGVPTGMTTAARSHRTAAALVVIWNPVRLSAPARRWYCRSSRSSRNRSEPRRRAPRSASSAIVGRSTESEVRRARRDTTPWLGCARFPGRSPTERLNWFTLDCVRNMCRHSNGEPGVKSGSATAGAHRLSVCNSSGGMT
jgi:hypothetical protein